ncbi:MAG: DUF2169 domain-containing protein [Xanthomonadales bacterium]|nr:DUF2169 domain-containing protein [Xanthomonadales bacterium]
MELINSTRMVAGYTMGMDPDGREYLVVVVKGTFDIPTDGSEPKLSDQQIPLIAADTFTGEPGFSSPVYESDYCLTKPNCDVLLIGSAYTANGRPAPYTRVGMKLGPISKTIDVIGDRTWSGRGGAPSEPIPFTVMPITYDRAFGGVDDSNPDKAKAFNLNPVGMGFRPLLKKDELQNQAVPNTQESGKPVMNPKGNYQPMSFGPIGRSWPPRLGYAGTYDDAWLDDNFPFLPPDFDTRYYQAAPVDQQMPYPRGGEQVTLVNLTPDGRRSFNLPVIDVPVVFFHTKGERHQTTGVIDTIVIEPEKNILTLTWRANLQLKKNIFEIPQVLTGKMSRGWWRARETGKTYYPSLAQLIEANKAETGEEVS